jgi:hypothetical protein
MGKIEHQLGTHIIGNASQLFCVKEPRVSRRATDDEFVTTARLASPRFELTSPETAELAIRHLNRFHASCLLNGARVYYSHPPCDRSYFASFGAQIEALEILLRARLTIPIVDTPEEMTFSESEIFDLGYHLNLKGKTARSRFLAARLREFMPGETPLTVPRVP